MTTPSLPVPPGTYVSDPLHSTFGFAVRHNGVATYQAQFDKAEAQLVDGVLTGTAYVESIRIGMPAFVAALLSPEFFNAAETPTVTFRSSHIRVSADGGAEVDGDLTIRGVTRPVTANGAFATGAGMMGHVVGFDLQASIDRRDFGLNWQALLPSGRISLGWDVALIVHLELAATE